MANKDHTNNMHHGYAFCRQLWLTYKLNTNTGNQREVASSGDKRNKDNNSIPLCSHQEYVEALVVETW